MGVTFEKKGIKSRYLITENQNRKNEKAITFDGRTESALYYNRLTHAISIFEIILIILFNDLLNYGKFFLSSSHFNVNSRKK